LLLSCWLPAFGAKRWETLCHHRPVSVAYVPPALIFECGAVGYICLCFLQCISSEFLKSSVLFNVLVAGTALLALGRSVEGILALSVLATAASGCCWTGKALHTFAGNQCS